MAAYPEATNIAVIMSDARKLYREWLVSSSKFYEQSQRFKSHWEKVQDIIHGQDDTWRAENRPSIDQLYDEVHKLMLRFEQVDPVLCDIRRAVSDFKDYQVPETDVGGAFEQFKIRWIQLKDVIASQSEEWRTSHIELTNEVSVQAHELMLRFETVLLQDNSSAAGAASNAPIDMDVDASNLSGPPAEERNQSDQTSSSAANVVTTSQTEQKPIVTMSNATTISGDGSALSVTSQGANSGNDEQQKKVERHYSMDALKKVNQILIDLTLLPRMPEQAEPKHFENLRAAINKVLDRLERANCTVEQFAPIIMAFANRVLNKTTQLLWDYELTRGKISLSGFR